MPRHLRKTRYPINISGGKVDIFKKIVQPVLVTGATGFIGQQVVRKLLAADLAVRALVLPEETPPEEWGKAAELVRGSIDDPEAVIHLAAVVSDGGDETRFWRFTADGSRLVFQQARENGSRVVLASSIVVYGD